MLRTIVTTTVLAVSAIVTFAAAHPAEISGLASPAVSAPAMPLGLVPCLAEDASTPGQAFPCRWEASQQGNGSGESFTVWEDGSFDYS
jgi:hypothetical protein